MSITFELRDPPFNPFERCADSDAQSAPGIMDWNHLKPLVFIHAGARRAQHITKALLCCELRNKSVVLRESFPSDPIPRMTQRDLKEPLFPFVSPIVFDMRLCRRLGTAWRARGPVRPHWICWVAGFSRFTCFTTF